MDYVKGAIKNSLDKEEVTPEMIESVVNPKSVDETAERITDILMGESLYTPYFKIKVDGRWK